MFVMIEPNANISMMSNTSVSTIEKDRPTKKTIHEVQLNSLDFQPNHRIGLVVAMLLTPKMNKTHSMMT